MAIHEYRVRAGYTYGALDQFKAGDIVELDDSVAIYNLDKLELVEVIPPVPPTPVEEEEMDRPHIQEESEVPVIKHPTIKRSIRKSSKKAG